MSKHYPGAGDGKKKSVQAEGNRLRKGPGGSHLLVDTWRFTWALGTEAERLQVFQIQLLPPAGALDAETPWAFYSQLVGSELCSKHRVAVPRAPAH